MARRKEAGHGGGHGWFVTFADLMGLLVSFFVMLVAFSTQDQAKLQVVAGSMRDAFGVQAIVDDLLIESASVLFTRDSFLGDGECDCAVAKQTGTHIVIVGIEAENICVLF